jgi:toxin HigB-1
MEGFVPNGIRTLPALGASPTRFCGLVLTLTRYPCRVAGMIRSFADQATEDVYHGRNSKAARRLPKDLWVVIRRKLDYIDAALFLTALRQPAGNRLEKLKGDQAGRYSIRVNDQYRITFRFEDGDALEVRCEDYH